MRLYRSKYEEVVYQLSPSTRTLLDVGCRDAVLERYLPKNIKYRGIDLVLGPNVSTVCNAERGLPFPDNSFDVVVALDVLEHTENIWVVFEEILRVSLCQIIIVLPNSYHWKARLRFLLGKEGDKYRLPPTPVTDRHRWLTSYFTSVNFANNMAAKFELSLEESIMVDEGKNRIREAMLKFLSPNLMSTAALFSFRKKLSYL